MLAFQAAAATARHSLDGEAGSKMVDGPELEAADGAVLKADRRRPGRLAKVSPELIPLLRGQGPALIDPEHQFGNPDQLHGARGVAAGVMIGAAIWAAVGYAVYCIL